MPKTYSIRPVVEKLESRTLMAATWKLPTSLNGLYMDFVRTDGTPPFPDPDQYRVTFFADKDGKNKADVRDSTKPDVPQIADYTYEQFTTVVSHAARINLALTGKITIFLDGSFRFNSPYGGTFQWSARRKQTLVGWEKGTFTAFPQPGTGTYRGTVYDDIDANGKQDAGENGLPGVTVFIDRNGDGIRQSTERARTTDTRGAYAFKNINTGYHRTSAILPAGRRSVSPSGGVQIITLMPGATYAHRDFGLTQQAHVSGVLWVDMNRNGKLDSNFDTYPTDDYGAGWVYVDENDDGKFQESEPNVWVPPGQGGVFSMNLAPGTYTLRWSFNKNKLVTPAQGYYKLKLAPSQNVSNLVFFAPVVLPK
ncbi:MAG TPA: SdrD B-like domain-containing protein [Tepidisphaeraceae bacterium]|jgi:hypothetical protein